MLTRERANPPTHLNHRKKMAYKPTPEYESAQLRISSLLDQIGAQLASIQNNEDVDTIVGEQEKSEFIYKQATLIDTILYRDEVDTRDAYIAELETRLASAEKKAKEERDRWFMEFKNNQHLKNALKSLTAVIAQDALC